MIKLSTTAVALLCACAVLASCGSGGGKPEPLTKAELVDQADAVCKRVNTRVQSLAAPTDSKSAAEVLQKTVDITEQGLDDLHELGPPQQLASAYEDWLAGLEQLVGAAKQARDAAKKDDQPGFEKSLKKGNTLNKQAKKAAAKIGLDECAKSS